jgi:hypothetical protein
MWWTGRSSTGGGSLALSMIRVNETISGWPTGRDHD